MVKPHTDLSIDKCDVDFCYLLSFISEAEAVLANSEGPDHPACIAPYLNLACIAPYLHSTCIILPP